jgi:hypothetical protein
MDRERGKDGPAIGQEVVCYVEQVEPLELGLCKTLGLFSMKRCRIPNLVRPTSVTFFCDKVLYSHLFLVFLSRKEGL